MCQRPSEFFSWQSVRQKGKNLYPPNGGSNVASHFSQIPIEKALSNLVGQWGPLARWF
jgi:hypothetical protein